MTRNEIITEINDLFDENIKLKNETEYNKQYYENIIKRIEKGDTVYAMDSFERKIYEIGLKKLYEEGFKPYYGMKKYGENEFYTLEEWLERSIDLTGFNDVSKNEFICLFKGKMKIEYEKRLEKAKKEE